MKKNPPYHIHIHTQTSPQKILGEPTATTTNTNVLSSEDINIPLALLNFVASAYTP